jgi:signal transduction histidine kinase
MATPQLDSEGLARLAEMEASLRQVATFAARGATYQELFGALDDEAVRRLPVHDVFLIAFEPDRARLVAGRSRVGKVTATGEWRSLEAGSFLTTVALTGQPAHTDDARELSILTGDENGDTAPRAGISLPVTVGDHVWGALTATTAADPDAQTEAEHCLRPFADLLEASIENEETRAGLARLAEEQQALRELATLAARGARPDELFAAATAAAGRIVRADIAVLGYFEADGTVSYLASWSETGEPPPIDTHLHVEGESLTSIIAQTGRPARIDYAEATGELADRARAGGATSGVAAPITVGGLAWGLIATLSAGTKPLPPETESRLAAFTELLGTAIANADSTAGRARLTREQTAMRRLATLVVAESAAEELFAAATEETGMLLEAELVALVRFDAIDAVTVVAAWSRIDGTAPAQRSWRLAGDDIASVVARTGRTARIDNYGVPFDEIVGDTAAGEAVATPVIVRGRVWGVLVVFARQGQPLLPDDETSLADIGEMMARALANAEGRAEVAASRARTVAAADDARRRIERNLHDGAQQRLVSLGLELRATQAAVPQELGEIRTELEHLAKGLLEVQDELREIARGIHPAILAEGGLGPALKTLARRSAVPVELAVQPHRRLPEPVEVAAYYVVSEALTNAARHAQPSLVRLEVEVSENVLRLCVFDDGVGGADPTRGSGLVGLTDRVEALAGTITIDSPVGAGTALRVELPLATDW